MKKLIILSGIFLIALLATTLVKAQTNFTLYHMKLVPYRMADNPALFPQARSFVGTPGISSLSVKGYNAFSYSDLITRGSDDSLKLDFDNLIKVLDDKNNFFTNVDIDLFSFGFQVKEKHYFSFSLSEHVIMQSMYPKSLLNLIWKGNAPAGLGNELLLSPKMDALMYDEFAVGLAEKVNEKFTFGIRFKLINGQANVYTDQAFVSLYTDPVDYSYRIKSNISIRTSGIDGMENRNASSFFKGGNLGFGIDLGSTYQFNPQFSVSASILNLGAINWKKNLLELKSRNPGEETIFEGIDINDYIADGKTNENALETALDSLADDFKIDSVYNQSYKTSLPMHFYAGADYNLNDKNTVGFLLNGQFYDSKFLPSYSLSYYTQLGRVLGLTASYNVINKTYNNIGFGFSLNMGSLQLYATSDNVLAFIKVKEAQTADFHTGLVWTFGRKPIEKAE